MKMGASESSVVGDCVRNQVVVFSGANKPAKESDRGAARHNELWPPSKDGEHAKETLYSVFQK